MANVDTGFVYTLVPRSGAGDSGFNVLRMALPGPMPLEDVIVEIGNRQVSPQRLDVRDDSLLISLQEVVMDDTVRIGFRTRLLSNATVVGLDIGHSDRPGLWQSVEPAENKRNVVFLPDVPGSSALIRDLSVHPGVITPNGDGMNEKLQLEFAILKVESGNATVRIFDLTGTQLAELHQGTATGLVRFTWSGIDDHGRHVPPGLYLASVEVGSQSGVERIVRPFAVAY